MLFAATRKELEIMTLSEVRKTNITDITYIRNLKKCNSLVNVTKKGADS